jgi:hypothetical protein
MKKQMGTDMGKTINKYKNVDGKPQEMTLRSLAIHTEA